MSDTPYREPSKYPFSPFLNKAVVNSIFLLGS
jgi:hypothetical protein